MNGLLRSHLFNLPSIRLNISLSQRPLYFLLTEKSRIEKEYPDICFAVRGKGKVLITVCVWLRLQLQANVWLNIRSEQCLHLCNISRRNNLRAELQVQFSPCHRLKCCAQCCVITHLLNLKMYASAKMKTRKTASIFTLSRLQ